MNVGHTSRAVMEMPDYTDNTHRGREYLQKEIVHGLLDILDNHLTPAVNEIMNNRTGANPITHNREQMIWK